jgi:hypothetical protein
VRRIPPLSAFGVRISAFEFEAVIALLPGWKQKGHAFCVAFFYL